MGKDFGAIQGKDLCKIVVWCLIPSELCDSKTIFVITQLLLCPANGLSFSLKSRCLSGYLSTSCGLGPFWFPVSASYVPTENLRAPEAALNLPGFISCRKNNSSWGPRLERNHSSISFFDPLIKLVKIVSKWHQISSRLLQISLSLINQVFIALQWEAAEIKMNLSRRTVQSEH